MSTAADRATETPLEAAAAAVEHILTRIRMSPEVGYYLGVGSESFDRLIRAHAAITGQTEGYVEETFAPARARDPRKDLLEKIEDLERQLSGRHDYEPDLREEPCYGPKWLTAEEMFTAILTALALEGHHPDRCIREIASLFHPQQVPYALLVS